MHLPHSPSFLPSCNTAHRTLYKRRVVCCTSPAPTRSRVYRYNVPVIFLHHPPEAVTLSFSLYFPPPRDRARTCDLSLEQQYHRCDTYTGFTILLSIEYFCFLVRIIVPCSIMLYNPSAHGAGSNAFFTTVRPYPIHTSIQQLGLFNKCQVI